MTLFVSWSGFGNFDCAHWVFNFAVWTEDALADWTEETEGRLDSANAEVAEVFCFIVAFRDYRHKDSSSSRLGSPFFSRHKLRSTINFAV